jgi:hypothetical protein
MQNFYEDTYTVLQYRDDKRNTETKIINTLHLIPQWKLELVYKAWDEIETKF